MVGFSPIGEAVASPTPRRSARILAFASLLLLFLYSGYCLQALPVVAPSLLKDWGIPARTLAVPLALISIGTSLGAVLGGVLGDLKGRKLPIIGLMIVQGIAMGLSAFASDPLGLYVLMFAVGLALGGYYPSGMALITELAPVPRRGLMISLAVLFAPLGLGACSLIASQILPLYGWSSVFLVGGLVAIPVTLFLAFLVPESPKYLARFPAREVARQRIVARLGLEEQDEPAPPIAAPAQSGLSAIPALLAENAGATLALWLLFFTVYVLGSVILGWIPVILSSVGFDLAFASQSLFYWTLGSMIGTPLAGWLIGRIGVYNSAASFAFGAVLAIALLTFVPLDPARGRLIATLLPLGGFSIAGVITCLYTLAAEFYPTALRATGIGTADAMGRVGGVLGALAGVYVFDLAGAFGFFATILTLTVLTLILILLLRRSGNVAAVEARGG